MVQPRHEPDRHWIVCEESESSDDESLRMSSRSGSQNFAPSRTPSSMSKRTTRRSGSQRGAASKCMTSQSGSQGKPSVASRSMSSSSGLHGEMSSQQHSVSSAAEHYGTPSAAGGDALSSSTMASGSASVKGAPNSPKEKDLSNPWSRFQHENRGKGLSKETMAKIYQYEKAKHHKNI